MWRPASIRRVGPLPNHAGGIPGHACPGGWNGGGRPDTGAHCTRSRSTLGEPRATLHHFRVVNRRHCNNGQRDQ